MPYWVWIVIGVAAVVLVGAIVLAVRANRTRKLRSVFGP